MVNISLGHLLGASIVLSGLFSLACAINPLGKIFIPSVYKLNDKKRTTYRLFYGLSGIICAGFGVALLIYPELVGS